MDDIVWIREEPTEQPKSNDTTLPNGAPEQNTSRESDGFKVDEDGSIEIPVKIEFKSTEVPFYKKPEEPQPSQLKESQDENLVVEIYDGKSPTVKASEPAEEDIPVVVCDPTSTTVPAYVPVEVEVFDPTSTDIPVIIDHTTPGLTDGAAKPAQSIQNDATAPVQNETNAKSKEEDGFDITTVEKCEDLITHRECERKLNETTEETRDLVNKLCDKSAELNQNAQTIANDLATQKKYFIEDVHKTIEDIDQMPPPPELPSGGLPKNVESIIIGEGVTKDVTGCIVLPNGTILVTDEQQGLILFDTQGNVLRKVTNSGWRNPRSPIYYKEHILMLIDMEEEKGIWNRYVFKFTSDVQYIARIEGPKWMRDEKTIISERLSIAHTDYLYLCICGEIFSALYELSPVGQWTELLYRLSESYVDMLAFAVIGPITQVLVVEGRKNYVLQISIRDSEVVNRHRLAVCERPGAMARDEAGRLFVANRSSATIQLVDTVRWSSARNVALTDSMVPHFSASWGMLAIPLKGAVRLHRYSFRSGCK